MKILVWAVIALSSVLSTGCAVTNTDAADKFRQMVLDDPNGNHSSITLRNSSGQVINIIKNRTAPCLDRTVVMTTQNKYGKILSEQTLKYNPTLVIDDSTALLTVQLLINGVGMVAGETPEKGMYVFLADIVPVSEEQTRLDIYRNEYPGAARIEDSIKDWVIRKSLKCPDLNKK
jgi:hypothetical protein